MNSKKRFLGIALIVTSALFLLSCGGTTVTQGENWLASKTDKPYNGCFGNVDFP